MLTLGFLFLPLERDTVVVPLQSNTLGKGDSEVLGNTGNAMGSSGPGAVQPRAGDLVKQKHQKQTGRQRQRLFGLVGVRAGRGTVVQTVQP